MPLPPQDANILNSQFRQHPGNQLPLLCSPQQNQEVCQQMPRPFSEPQAHGNSLRNTTTELPWPHQAPLLEVSWGELSGHCKVLPTSHPGSKLHPRSPLINKITVLSLPSKIFFFLFYFMTLAKSQPFKADRRASSNT